MPAAMRRLLAMMVNVGGTVMLDGSDPPSVT